ncbi:hypothetical protein B0H14DRAFT_2857999 [Mycena olivaceomarginata]|nr:hypothetical protein B0H14DRAFT_2857999 [Mycena olivaceomarginata]
MPAFHHVGAAETSPYFCEKKPDIESQLEQLIRKQKATEKALAKANAQLIAKRNQDLLDEDEEEAAARPRKKAKQASAPPPDEFGEEDSAALDGLLGADRTTHHRADSPGLSVAGSDPNDPDLGEDSDADDSATQPLDLEMVVGDVDIPKTPKAKRIASNSRVTQATFSPMSVRLANVGRYAVRVGIATEEGFPGDHATFTWDAITHAVESLNAPEVAERFNMAKESNERRAQLVSYAWSGAPQLRGEVKTLCKSAVKLFGIPGEYSPAEIAKHIKFLTGKKGIFKFGGINLQDQTYDRQRPFGAAFYHDVMTKQWFDTAKSEGVRATSFRNFIDSPIPVLTLVTDGMENALKEWSTGVRIQIKFTEEEFGPRYQHHRATLLNLQTKSPTWFTQFQRNLYSKIISTSNFHHLKQVVAEPDEDELDGVDFNALEESVAGSDP